MRDAFTADTTLGFEQERVLRLQCLTKFQISLTLRRYLNVLNMNLILCLHEFLVKIIYKADGRQR